MEWFQHTGHDSKLIFCVVCFFLQIKVRTNKFQVQNHGVSRFILVELLSHWLFRIHFCSLGASSNQSFSSITEVLHLQCPWSQLFNLPELLYEAAQCFVFGVWSRCGPTWIFSLPLWGPSPVRWKEEAWSWLSSTRRDSRPRGGQSGRKIHRNQLIRSSWGGFVCACPEMLELHFWGVKNETYSEKPFWFVWVSNYTADVIRGIGSAVEYF